MDDLNINEENALLATGHAGETIDGGKIEGSYTSVIKMMGEKHMSQNRELHGDVICLDSYDVAEHI